MTEPTRSTPHRSQPAALSSTSQARHHGAERGTCPLRGSANGLRCSGDTGPPRPIRGGTNGSRWDDAGALAPVLHTLILSELGLGVASGNRPSRPSERQLRAIAIPPGNINRPTVLSDSADRQCQATVPTDSGKRQCRLTEPSDAAAIMTALAPDQRPRSARSAQSATECSR